MKLGGSVKENTKTCLPTLSKPPAIKTAGFWVIVYIPETIMTAELLEHCMTG